MSAFNKGEDYIRQLAKQSTENARQRAENLDAPNPYPAPSTSRNFSPSRDANNAGEEYVQQLARNSTDLARRRSEAFAQARRNAQQDNSPTERTLDSVASAPTNNLKRTERERALAELEKLNEEADKLQNLLESRQKSARESIDIPNDIYEPPPKRGEDIEAIEARLTAADQPPANPLDDQIAEIEAKLATREKSPVDPDISVYEELRAKLDRSVSEDEDGVVSRFVDDETRVAVPRATESKVAEQSPDLDVSQMNEVERMRRGMVELRLEAERYARATRQLQEKHDQMMRVIIENYMPGL